MGTQRKDLGVAGVEQQLKSSQSGALADYTPSSEVKQAPASQHCPGASVQGEGWDLHGGGGAGSPRD